MKDRANLPMLNVIKPLMNKNFISEIGQEKIAKGIKGFTENYKEKMNFTEQDLKNINDTVTVIQEKSKKPQKKSIIK